MNIPKAYLKLVGTEQSFSGRVFSRKKSLEPTTFKVLDIRAGSATIMNIKELRENGKSSYSHPTFELLLKNDAMKRAQWTKPFPIREINLNK